ncbi:hypothetical protein ACHWQZ_G007632 [Mnemiopsis leidyi]
MKNIRCEDEGCTYQHLVFTRNCENGAAVPKREAYKHSEVKRNDAWTAQRAVDYHKTDYDAMSQSLSGVNWGELWTLCKKDLDLFLELMRLTILQVTFIHSPAKDDNTAFVARKRRANRNIYVMKRKMRKLNARIRALERVNPGSERLEALQTGVSLLCYSIQEGTLQT